MRSVWSAGDTSFRRISGTPCHDPPGHVNRGGGWNFYAMFCRAAEFDGVVTAIDTDGNGIRIVRKLK
jgi:hypothetical protein